MALSEEERRLLEQMESALAAEDPELAKKLRGTHSRRIHRRRLILSIVGLVAGLAALIVGMELGIYLSIVGFLVMLVSVIMAVRSWEHATGHGVPSGHDAEPQHRHGPREA